MTRPTLIHAHLKRCVEDRAPELVELRVPVHASETARLTALRLCAVALFYEPGFELRGEVCQGDLPAAWLRADGARYARWFELGSTTARRVRHAQSRADEVVLITDREPERAASRAQQLPSGLLIVVLEEAFVARLAAHLERRLRWRVELAGDVLRVVTPVVTLTSAVTRQAIGGET